MSRSTPACPTAIMPLPARPLAVAFARGGVAPSTATIGFRRCAHGVAALLLAFLGGCGPTGLVLGVADVARNDTRRIVVILFVNQTGATVQVQLTADAIDGQVVALPTMDVPADSLLSVAVPESRCVRVRGREQTTDPGRAPLTWDYDVAPAADANATVCTLERQTVLLSELRATGAEPERIDLQRLVTVGNGAQFERVASSELAVQPDRVVLHPSGGYLYALRDLGNGFGEIHAFRLDAETGRAESIVAEFGTAPTNPRQFAYRGDFAGVDLFVEPSGRAAYLVDRLPTTFRSALSVYDILADGSLGAPTIGMRGLIGDLEFRQDGAFLALSESFGGSLGFMARVLQVDADGVPGALVAEARMPCLNTDGGAVALHPNGRFLYFAFRDDGTDRVKIGAYFLGATGEFFLIEDECSDFATLVDLTFDPDGAFLYITGRNNAGGLRVLRYPLDPITGQLGAISDDQDLGEVSTLTASSDPDAPAAALTRSVVHVAIDDTLVAHAPGPNGALQPLAGQPTLPYGSSASTRLVQGTQRGLVRVSSQ
jgi:6-phosphogluconolactonase (cycloisomerase 2 family)